MGLRAFQRARDDCTDQVKPLRFTAPQKDGVSAVRTALIEIRHRLQPVTLPHLLDCGVRYFTWISPSENIGEIVGASSWPHGAFAYFYAPSAQTLDCYFAVKDGGGEPLQDGPPSRPTEEPSCVPLAALFSEFMNGRELTISQHVQRFERLLDSLLRTDSVYPNMALGDYYDAPNRIAIDTLACVSRNRQKLPMSAQSLFGSRDSNTGLPARREFYVAKGYCAGNALKVLVLGGGPMGLYAACELALLGHSVMVYERHDDMSRLNVLALWPETEQAFKRHLYLDHFDPWISNGRGAACDTTTHASTTRLQQALLKAALMLGVRFELRPPSSTFSLADANGFDALVNAAGQQQDLLQTFAREAKVAKHEGFPAKDPEPFATRSVPVECTTAMVAHFELTDRTDAAKSWMDEMISFEWKCSDAKQDARSSKQPSPYAADAVATRLLEELPALSPPLGSSSTLDEPLGRVICIKNSAYDKISTGRNELGNLRGAPPSFCWLATLRPCFVESVVTRMVDATARKRGVTASTQPFGQAGLVQWAYEQSERDGVISKDAYRTELNKVATAIATVFTSEVYFHANGVEKPAEQFTSACRLLREVRGGATATGGDGYADGQWEETVQMFDFSESRRMANAAVEVTHVNGVERAQPLLVCFAGDALHEPFWPEGLGINRGTHSVQDSVWAVNQWRHALSSVDDRAAVIAERQALYDRFTCQLSNRNRTPLLWHDPTSGGRVKEGIFGTTRRAQKSLADQYLRNATVDPCTRYNFPRCGFGFQPLRLSADAHNYDDLVELLRLQSTFEALSYDDLAKLLR